VDHAARQGVSATAAPRGGYGAGARILSIGIASTGVVTFAYFSVASYVLDDARYKGISLLWSILFVTVSVIYRPIEQLLSRTIAARRARGLHGGHPLRTPLLIQAGFALAFLIVALALHGPIVDLFDGATALYWVLVVGVLAYAASYFARGWLAGHQWFGLYGGLVFMESSSRLLFAVAVAIGIASGQSAVAMGMAAAPFVSLVVVPLAFARRPRERSPAERSEEQLGLARGGRFAVAVLAIMLAEQTLLNGGVLAAQATSPGTPVAGYVFNALLIARAPLQLFQAVQGSLLPHLAGLHASEGGGERFARAVRITIAAIAGFAAVVALGLLAIGPPVMSVLFSDHAAYGRLGLAAVGLGMGAHLAAGTLNQAALARDHAPAAAGAWLLTAAAFVGWMLLPAIGDELARAEVGYLGAALLLCALLTALYRRPRTHLPPT
jgi:O-antigen/teichoic acid export membrane protein